MVQRKVTNKLGIQGDHVKSEKLLANLKTSSYQHQDGKARGADMKKKMKKSRSIKCGDLESLGSPNLVPQHGKPPPIHAPISAATPQKQSPNKALDASPNYMKSTSSSDAKKERSPVSTQSPQAGTNSKTPSRKNANNSKHGSVSGFKPARALVRTSSLKLVRTPTFKPSRASTRKCSPVVLCENLDVRRATCSSTLKDSKFPAYLTLDHGGTESEGTSIMKVCPYSYCSLNGHHHTPLPPLKCFLSTRRRMLKIQKSIKLGCLSPRQARPLGDDTKTKEIGSGQVTFEGKSALEEPDFNSTVIGPLIQEDDTDFFIEIYTKHWGDAADGINRSQHKEQEAGQVAESLLDESVQNNNVSSTEMHVSKSFNEEEQNAEEVDLVPPTSLALEQSAMECLINQRDSEVQNPPSIEPDELDSEASDMEWEAVPYCATYLDDANQTFNQSDMQSGDSWEIDKVSFHDEAIFNSDEIVSCCFEADEMPEEIFDEESLRSEAWLGDSDTDSVGSDQNLEGEVAITLVPAEKPLKESRTDMIGVAEADMETRSTIGTEEEASIENQENYFIHNSEVNALPGNQGPDSSHDFAKKDQDEAYKDLPESQNNSETNQNSLEQELLTVGAADKIEKEQGDAVKSLIGIQNFDLQAFYEADKEMTGEDSESHKLDANAKDRQLNLSFVNEGLPDECQGLSFDKQFQCDVDIEDQSHTQQYEDQSKSFNILNPTDSEDQKHSGNWSLRSDENGDLVADKMEIENESRLDVEELCFTVKNTSRSDTKITCSNQRGAIRCKRPFQDSGEQRKFNPREPNYLPVKPDPEAEKVALRHQMMDEKKNAEEWMLDYALQRAVTKLAPASKRKVALLVEAFETVMPVSKFETHLRHTSATLPHARPIQACS